MVHALILRHFNKLEGLMIDAASRGLRVVSNGAVFQPQVGWENHIVHIVHMMRIV